MQISIGQDDGLLHDDGIPQLVVLTVKTDDGKVFVFPYPAGKTIAELYEDINRKIKTTMLLSPVVDIHSPLLDQEKPAVIPTLRSAAIEVGDIVQCVNLLDRGPHSNDDLKVGEKYRVLEVVWQGGGLHHYEVISDTAPIKIRTMVFPGEVVLAKKAPLIKNPKAMVYEERCKCPACGEESSLTNRSILESGEIFYEGKCRKCGCVLSKTLPRPTA